MVNCRHPFHFLICLFGIVILMTSCKKYLDSSPDKKLTTPDVIQDLRALMDFNGLMNEDYSAYGAIASDDYFVTDEAYNSFSSSSYSEYYIWGLNVDPIDEHSDWLKSYQRIFYANVVLDNVDKVALNGASQPDLDAIKGEALFYRGYNHFLISQIYALPYNPATASSTPGVPLRLTSDVNVESTRPNLKNEFNSIIEDLKAAAPLLPDYSPGKLRPSRPATYAALANVYLIMQKYAEAEKMADAALAIDDSLLDYNVIQAEQQAPIPVLNKEVLWQADLAYKTILATSNAKVDIDFFQSYQQNDLRKYLYFDTSEIPVIFKGHYNGQYSGTAVYFGGLAVDELYLIKAESAARLGKLNESAIALNKLAINRFNKADFVPFDFTDRNKAINAILDMRRKELCFRGLYRWMDVRRLSQIPGEEITLHRTLMGKTYTLKPGDLHYAFLIPQDVIDNSKIEQNKR